MLQAAEVVALTAYRLRFRHVHAAMGTPHRTNFADCWVFGARGAQLSAEQKDHQPDGCNNEEDLAHEGRLYLNAVCHHHRAFANPFNLLQNSPLSSFRSPA